MHLNFKGAGKNDLSNQRKKRRLDSAEASRNTKLRAWKTPTHSDPLTMTNTRELKVGVRQPTDSCAAEIVEEWNSVEVPSWRGSSQWINGMRGQQVWLQRRGRQRTCAGVQCTVKRKVKHDAWMNDLCWERKSNMSQTHMSSVLCNDCACEKGGVRQV